MAGFTAVTTELLPSGLLPQISRDLGVEESAVGSLTAAYAAVIVITALPLSRLLGGRMPRKTLLIVTVLAFALSNVLLAASPNLTLAIAARLLGGVAHGLLWSSMAPYVARIVPAHSVGKAMAIVFSGNSIALAVGAPIGTMMGSVLSWRTSFLVLAGIAALLALLALRLLPPASDADRDSAPSLRAAMALPGVIAVATAWPLLLLGHFALFTYIAPFLLAAGLPSTATGISLSVIGVASLVGIWIAGLTADARPRGSVLTGVALLLTSFVLLPRTRRHLDRRPRTSDPVGHHFRSRRHLQPGGNPPRRRRAQGRRKRADRGHDPAGHRRRCRVRCAGPQHRRRAFRAAGRGGSPGCGAGDHLRQPPPGLPGRSPRRSPVPFTQVTRSCCRFER
jgi:predicted MFS family arabinose efflux permease